MRNLVWFVGAALLGALLWLTISRPTADPRIETRPTPEDRSDPEPRVGSRAAAERTQISSRLRVVDPAGLGLHGVELRPYAPRGDGALDGETEVLASTDADGLLSDAGLSQPARRFALQKPGFATLVVEGSLEPERIVEMQPAYRVEILCVSEHGTALPGCRVTLSSRPMDRMEPLVSDARADPSSGNPCWMQTTDESGVAAFDSVPPGDHRLNIYHDDFVPEPEAVQGLLTVDSDVRLEVVAKELWGAAFSAPSKSPVEAVTWAWNRLDFDHSPHLLARLGHGRRRLQQRMPDAQVFAHRPAALQNIPDVECQVALVDGTFWIGRGTLRPLSQLREAALLEQDIGTPRRRVRVELRSRSGELLDIGLTAQLEGSSHRWSVGPGTYILLAHGRYWLSPQIYAAWSAEAFDGLQFEISESQPLGDVVTVTLDREFVPVEVVPVFPDEQIASNIFVSIDDEAQEGLTVAGWNPSRGPILLHAPAGDLAVHCYSPAYEETRLTTKVPFEPSKRSERGVSRVLLPLTRRSEPK